ncbi:MAG: liaR [Chloroflexi bacterium]|nr:liaR [Chloroflexota bacterium]
MTTGAPDIGIFLVDDHPLVLEGIEHLLRAASHMRVIGKALTGRDAVAMAPSLRPDIILTDLSLPDLYGAELCHQLRTVAPWAKTVILTGFVDHQILDACLDAGAAGILVKDTREGELIRALTDIHAGALVVDARVRPDLASRSRPAREDEGRSLGLTPRERQMLWLLAQGRSTEEICEVANLTRSTVRSYLQSLLEKLDARNRVEALAVARRHHLI